jgi:hypothetical protein
MTRATAAVLAEALRLDEKARAELAAELLASLDGPADPGAETEWAKEIERRVAAIESGQAVLEPWDDLKRRIERDNPRPVSLPIRTSSPASAELTEAVRWYESKRRGLGGELLNEVARGDQAPIPRRSAPSRQRRMQPTFSSARPRSSKCPPEYSP